MSASLLGFHSRRSAIDLPIALATYSHRCAAPYLTHQRAYYDDGEITSISHQTWECSCHVVNHICEVCYKFDSDGFTRTVNRTNKTNMDIHTWRALKAPYLNFVSDSVKSDMREVYEAIAPEYGEDAYLGDGVWIRADGSMDDRER